MFSDWSFPLRTVISWICAGLLTYITTPLVKRISQAIGAIDPPDNDRHLHESPMPRLGGLSILAGAAVSFFLFAKITAPSFWFVLAGILLIGILGILDDIYSLNARWKLIVQLAAASIAVFAGGLRIGLVASPLFPLVRSVWDPGILSGILTVLWIIAVTNAFNFIDGLDGLCCGISGISALCVLVIALLQRDPVSAVASAALLGACIGFMPYNAPPAKIFMGDIGATFLGFILACLSIRLVWSAEHPVSTLVPLLLFALPVIDAVCVIIRRLLSGHDPMEGDRSHFHHRLLDRGTPVKKILLIAYLITAVAGAAAVLLSSLAH